MRPLTLTGSESSAYVLKTNMSATRASNLRAKQSTTGVSDPMAVPLQNRIAQTGADGKSGSTYLPI